MERDTLVAPTESAPESAPAELRVPGPPLARRNAVWGPLLVLSVLYAAFTGFRLPNLWSATLYTVSLPDGFRRRFLVGTLLRPLSAATGYDYWLYATAAFVVLGVLLAVIVVAALRSPLVSQRFLALAFFLLPTGGYLFHEVGYLDQVLYLLLFASMWLSRRSWWYLAPLLMSLAVVTHEITVLTVLPVFGFVVLRAVEPRRAVVMLLPPVVVALAVFAVPAASDGAVARLARALEESNFTPRADALSLFERSQSETWRLYRVTDVFLFLLPLAVAFGIAFVLLYWSGTRSPYGSFSFLYVLLALGAIGAPLLLAWAGWDQFRWAFLLTVNFLIVVWVWLGDGGRELQPTQWAALAAVLLVSLHSQLLYFDGLSPRSLHPDAVRELEREIRSGSFFDIPPR